MAGKILDKGGGCCLGNSWKWANPNYVGGSVLLTRMKKHKSFCFMGVLHKREKSSKQLQRSLLEEIYLKYCIRLNSIKKDYNPDFVLGCK